MSSSPPPPPPASSSTKLFIPQPKDEDPSCRIVGILERKRPEENTQGKPIALIIHGSMGHKDYIYQRKLAALLPIDSFRFDFRGNLESGGKWSLAALPNEIDDIQCVAHHLHTVYGYLIRVVIGHSKGSVTSCKWIAGATKPLPGEGGEEEEGGGGGEGGSEEARQVRAFVNVAGRHRMYVRRRPPVVFVSSGSFTDRLFLLEIPV
ncbi:hypothetical protein FRC20_008340 [Serendipita sp. 405]|nr:hypothetical protein FRC20_008340 [Serendipita sp. 405]